MVFIIRDDSPAESTIGKRRLTVPTCLTLLLSTLALGACVAGTPVDADHDSEFPLSNQSNTTGQSAGSPFTIQEGAEASAPDNVAEGDLVTDSSEVGVTIDNNLEPPDLGAAVTGENSASESGPDSGVPGSDIDTTSDSDTGNGDTQSEENPGTADVAGDPTVPVACTATDEAMQLRMLHLINMARSEARACGSDSYDAAPALSWNNKLMQAAKKHSGDMVQHNFFSHTGSDGSNIGVRVDETGYPWRAVGENIAAGQRSGSETVDGWLNSPGHCRNLMSTSFTEIAVTCAEDSGTDYTRYWTNVLAAPF